MDGATRTISRAAGLLRDRTTAPVALAKLEVMAALFNHLPALRHHLRDRHPTGVPFVFDASLEFVSWDGRRGLHLVFGDGKMRVRRGPAARADTTVRFRSPEQMRTFFAGGDTMNMLLDNTLKLEGNMSVLFKFAHMSTVIAQKGKPRAASASLHDHWPRDWRAMPAPPAGAPCSAPPPGEVRRLDDPHLADTTLDDLPRIKRLLWRLRTTRPAVCAERARLLTEYKLQAQQAGTTPADPVLRQAEAIHHILAHKQPIIRDDDLLAGSVTAEPIGVQIMPELGAIALWPELLTLPARELNPYDIDAQTIAALDREVFPYWMQDNIRDWAKAQAADRLPLELDERFVLYFMWKTQTISHTVIDLPRALSRGLLDIQREARECAAAADDERQRSFYRALELALEGVLRYAAHLAREARALAARPGLDSARRAELDEMARICDKVPARPAETLHEAIQAFWILFVCQLQETMGPGMVAGRLDSWLDPYLQRDLQHVAAADRPAAVTRALELCCALMLKLTDHLPTVPDVGNRLFGGSSDNHVITLGGLTRDGDSAVCDTTWLLLKATEMLRLRDPNVNARFAPGVNSEAYLRRLCEVNLLTAATPSLHNDAAVVSALRNAGFAERDARDWTATGCVEPTSCGRHFGHTNCMMLNLVAPLEMALNDGVHPVLGEQVGPHTGPVADFAAFDQLLAAYETQLAWLFDRAVEANNALGRAHQAVKPTPLLSALFDGPMDSGRDVTSGGARYNTSGTAMIGLTDVVDSLCAIETLVFERREVTLVALVAALDADFAGCGDLQLRLLNKVAKFGQDRERPGRMAAELMRFIRQRHQVQPHYRGGRYLPGYWSMSNHVAFGLLSGSLPSGRLRGQPFTPGLTPSHLARAALTDQIRTVAALDDDETANNIAFNVKVTPGGNDTPERVVDRMSAYVGSYFELGGMQLQFNVTSTDVLRHAMEHPEAHGDLLVRISGYNAYFVELNRDIQRELVERAEHSLNG